MADGQAAGLFGVVLEIGLHILVRVVADDLGGVLGGAHQTVRADAPELDGSLGGIVRQGKLAPVNGQVGHVVQDADGKVVVAALGQMLEDRIHVGGGGVLGGQAIAAADHPDVRAAGVAEHRRHIQVQGLAKGTGLLGAVQNRQTLNGLRQFREHVLGGEGAEEVDLQHAYLLALGGHDIHNLLQGTADRTHGHNHIGGVRGAVIIEGLIIGADGGIDLVHVLHHHVHQVVVGGVGGLSVLEEGLRGLIGAAVVGMMGQVRLGMEAVNGIPVHHPLQGLIVPGPQLLNLVGGAEAVEEVDKAHAGLDGGQVRHRRQVHHLLGSAGGQHCHAGAPACHDILVIPEDGQGVGGQGPRRHMEDSGQPLACNLIQIGDHEQQALGGGKGGGQRAGGQGAMDRACGAGLGLHFHDIDAVSKNISTVLVGPFVHMLRHGRGGRDGVNGSDFCKRIRHVAGGRVGVHTLKGSGISHFAAPPFCAAMART